MEDFHHGWLLEGNVQGIDPAQKKKQGGEEDSLEMEYAFKNALPQFGGPQSERSRTKPYFLGGIQY